MEDDLIIGSEEPVPKGPFTEENVDEDMVEWDETTSVNYVDTATLTLEKLLEIDDLKLAQFTELERSYIKKTKKMCIRIMHHYIKEIFDDLVTDDKTTEE